MKLLKFPRIVSVLLLTVILSACGGSDTSVETVEVTPGSVPNTLVGVYRGTLDARGEVSLLRLSESISQPITITVREDNTITFAGDDPDEVFTTDIGSNGGFNGSLPLNEDGCSGTLNVSGTVDGTNAQGSVGGSGSCEGLDVDITGSFSATRQ